MLIDLHSHELRYSGDSHQSLDAMTRQAAQLGIDGICVTDHDTQDLARELGWESMQNGVRVFVGCEVFTYEGDILVFGAKTLPTRRVLLSHLYDVVRAQKGAMIAAHPYRHNERGIRDGIIRHSHMLTAVEAYNGSTRDQDNEHAHRMAAQMGLPVVGAGDSHHTGAIGRYVTRFSQPVDTLQDLVKALHRGHYRPMRLTETGYQEIHLPETERIVG